MTNHQPLNDEYDSEDERPLQSLQSSLRSMQSDSIRNVQSEPQRRRDLIPKKTDLGIFGTTTRMNFGTATDGLSVEGRPYTTRNGGGHRNGNRNGNDGLLQRSNMRVKFPDLQRIPSLNTNNQASLPGMMAMPPSVAASGHNGRSRRGVGGDREMF